MWKISTTLDSCSTREKYNLLGRPEKILLGELWKEGEVVRPLQVPDSMVTNDVYLGDFGTSVRADALPDDDEVGDAFTPDYASPARLHGERATFACDMWSYMCILAKLYTGYEVFGCFLSGSPLRQIVDTLGPLPDRWRGLLPHATDDWYDQAKEPKPQQTLEAIIERARPDVSPEERGHAVLVLRRGFSYVPEERLSAAELLLDPSFNALLASHGY